VILTLIKPGELLTIVCQYTAEVAEGNNLTRLPKLSDETIMGYINATAKWIRCHTNLSVPLYSNEDALLVYRRKWTQKRDL
jgi:hypothetical protein